MKSIFFALLLLSTSAAIADNPPPTLLMPTELMEAIGKYLAQRPYAEVASLIVTLQSCASIQVPNSSGVQTSIASSCPAVAQAIQQKPDVKVEKPKADKK